MRLSIILIVLTFITFDATAGGGWVYVKGKGYFQLNQWGIISDEHYTDIGKIDPNITSGLFNTSVYGEYGVSNSFTAIAYLPFFSRSYYNNLVSGTTGNIIAAGEAINGLGDPIVGIKYGLIKNKPIVISSRVDIGIPLGISSGGETGVLQTGDGEFNQTIRFDVSTSKQIKKVNSYYSLYSGFNNRTRGFSDEFIYGSEVGFIFNDNLILASKVTGVKSFKNGSLTSGVNSTSIFANNSEYLTLSFNPSYFLTKKIGISLEYTQPVYGKIIFSKPSYSGGIFIKI